jgi:LCP family protein required for cell wall assembly
MPGRAKGQDDDVPGLGWKSGRRDLRGGRRGSFRMHVSAWVSVAVVSLLVIAALGAYIKFRTVWDSIDRVPLTDLGKQPPKLNDAENILLIGSDSRAGSNKKFGATVLGARSDTVILLHLAPGGRHATVISFPRDSVVPVLQCPAGNGFAGQQAEPAGSLPEQLNATFSYGGPDCLLKTLEQTTGIHIDHFVELTFTGFEKVIDDLGGVEVCLPFAVDDPLSGLHLSKGEHRVLGAQALAFWRTREDLGEGSDLQRIQRDQYLMASLVQGIEKSGLLKSPSKILKVISDAADAMVTDTGLDQSDMVHIAESLHALTSNDVEFVTVPNVAYPLNTNWVEWENPQAKELFRAIQDDAKLPKALRAKKKSTKSTPPVLDAKPSAVKVEVMNGDGVLDQAATVADALSSRGFDVTGTGDVSFTYTDSVIEYPSASEMPEVDTLKAELSDVTVEKNASLPMGTVELIVGSTYNGLKATTKAAESSTAAAAATLNSAAKDFGGITATANVCSDSAAFAGPDTP